MSYAGTVSSDGGSTVGEEPPVGAGETTEEPTTEVETRDTVPSVTLTDNTEEMYVEEHLNFVNGDVYKDRMNSAWAEVISTGLDTTSGLAGEAIYNVLDGASDLISFKASSLFENPYDVVIADLIMKQQGLEEKTFVKEYKNDFNDAVQDFEKLCKITDPNYEFKVKEYETSVEKLFSNPESVAETNPQFYEYCEGLFGKIIEGKKLDKWLGRYDKLNDMMDAYNKGVKVVEWVVDCFRYNSLVAAYLNTSDEFKQSLSACIYFMTNNAYDGRFLSRAQYAIYFEWALDKYARFITEDEISDEMYDFYYKKNLFKEYMQDGLLKLSDVFASTVRSHTLSYLSKCLGISGVMLSKITVALEAYNIGWSISDTITGNGDNIECRELARAYYFLEDAMREVVDGKASVLKNEKTYAAARAFDASYTALKNIEILSLENYIKYLNGQQTSFVPSVIHGFRRNFNEAEIGETLILKVEWQQANCHRTDYVTADGKLSVNKVCCPVDVEVYDKNGDMVLSIIDNVVSVFGSNVSAAVVNDIKTFVVSDYEDYTVKINATGDGDFNYITDLYSNDGKLISSTVYEGIDISTGDVFESEIEKSDLSKNDTFIESTNQTTDGDDKPLVQSLNIAESEINLEVGEEKKMEVEVVPQNVYCPVLSWTSSDEDVLRVDESGTVKALSVGTANVNMMAIDGSGVGRKITVHVKSKENHGEGDERIPTPDSTKKVETGDYIQLGRYNGQPILWRCAGEDENGKLMISDSVLCEKSFDAAYSGYDSSYRRNYGSNYWEGSCLKKWLNAAGSIDWESGAVPSADYIKGNGHYENEDGFLSNFTSDERMYVKEVSQKTYLNNLDSSLAEEGNSKFDFSANNEAFDQLFATLDASENKWCHTTTESFFVMGPEQFKMACENLGQDYMSLDTPYWLRLPCNSGMSYENVAIVNTGKKIWCTSAYDSEIGVRIAFYLNENMYPGGVSQDSDQNSEIQPTSEQPMSEQPTSEQPTTVQPVSERPATVQPVSEQPTTVQPVSERPATVQPVSEQPTTVQPVSERPATVQSVSEQPTTVQPVSEQPTTRTSVDTKKTNHPTTVNIKNKKTYKKSKKVTIKDADGIKTIKLNTQKIKITSGRKSVSFKLSKYKKYLKKKNKWNRLVITDKTGNKKTVQFKVK